ncbi:MAG: nucleotidyltransferase family protein [Clostridia bacterium]|nr:nucleotidyltransferase family protein [Clostridia bacterium]
MNVGVICELNPLHNGHAALFDRAKRLENGGNSVIAVMSGNYTQRGEPAILDKWRRTAMALSAGADMVLEIPSVFAQQSAQFFADAAVDIILKTGLCDAILFGSESGDVGLLEELAEKRVGGSSQDSLKELLDSGLSYPRALAAFYGRDLGANDILGVEYLVALKKRGSGLKAYAMKRIGNAVHTGDVIPEGCLDVTSAASIRKAVREDPSDTGYLDFLMPEYAAKFLREALFSGDYVPSLSAYSPLIIGKLREIGPSGIGEFPFAAGGIGECIYKAASETSDVDALIARATSRTFTSGRIRRIILATLTGARKDMISDVNSLPYIRVLGVSKKSEGLLSALVKNGFPGSPVIAGNIPKNFREMFPENIARLLSSETLATDYYYLGMANKNGVAGKELTTPLVKL